MDSNITKGSFNDNKEVEQLVANVYFQEIEYHKMIQNHKLNLENILKQLNPASNGIIDFKM